MARANSDAGRLVAIDPTTNGFGFAVFEGPDRLIDWGLCHVKGDKNAQCLSRAAKLLQRYRPTRLVVEDHNATSCRRHPRVCQLLARLAALATASRIKVCQLSRAAVCHTFATFGAANKDQVAAKIVSWFPELKPRLPKPRKPWKSEDDRLGIFDALALAITFADKQPTRHQPRISPRS